MKPSLVSVVLLSLLALVTASCQRGGGAQSGPPALKNEANAASQTEASAEEPAAASAAMAPASGRSSGVNVRVQVLEPSSIAAELTYVGNVLPQERLTLKSEAEGIVEELKFDEGNTVKRGQVMAHISTKEQQVRLDMARADYKLAQVNFERDEQLSLKSLIPQAQYDQSEARRDSAKLAAQLAEINVKKSVVQAPMQGAIKTRFIKLGEFVRKGEPVAEILDMRKIKVELNIPERDIIGLKVGQTVQVEPYVMEGTFLEGNISKIGLEADARNRSFPVEVSVDNTNQNLRSGMLARVVINRGEQTNQVVIPRNAIIEREKGRIVFLEDSGTAVERMIETGITDQDRVQVTSGLALGDRLIVEGHTKLTNREAVVVR